MEDKEYDSAFVFVRGINRRLQEFSSTKLNRLKIYDLLHQVRLMVKVKSCTNARLVLH